NVNKWSGHRILDLVATKRRLTSHIRGTPASDVQGLKPFVVHTVAEHARPIIARGGLHVNPEHTFDDCPDPDIGTRREMNNSRMLTGVKDNGGKGELLLSVCSGALVLGKAGLLDGLTATTHHCALDELRAISPQIKIDSSRRFIDNGGVIVSGGISAGIDMSLHVVSRLLGEDQAAETAKYMEYQGNSQRYAALAPALAP